MKLYNTMTKRKEEFEPAEPNKVKMYVCGPTVYNFIHIGNARPYVVFDTVRRYLSNKGYDVVYVQNYTDIDDKIIKKALEENSTMEDIANTYIKEALEDARGLNVQQASYHPRVTEEMDSIIQMIAVLLEKGHAYEKDGTIFFDTQSIQDYGKLSKKNIDELNAGARIEIDKAKKSPMDFVLWKPNKKGEPFWPSPWGDGRPGWHIECSVMAKKYLGDTIDIHAGGEDLIFPHHENEIAQSEAANGRGFSKYWMHNGFITVDNQKMSKSLGNFFVVRDIVKQFPYEVIRFFILSAHYRSPLNFSFELMQSAQNSLERIKNCILNLEYFEKNNHNTQATEEEIKILSDSGAFKTQFENAMEDDFNTADAIAAIFDFVKYANKNADENSSKQFVAELKEKILSLCAILGLLETKNENLDAEEIEALIVERNNARKNKDFALADKIRNNLGEKGIILEDTTQGTRWAYKGR